MNPIKSLILPYSGAAIALAAATCALGQISVTGVAHKATYTDQATFTVSFSNGYTGTASLNGIPVPTGSSVAVPGPDYYELSVTATNSTGTIVRNFTQFVVAAGERRGTETGLPPWVPYPRINSSAEEFVGSELQVMMPAEFPAGLPIPAVFRVATPSGQTLRANGLVRINGDASIPVLRGVGSGFLRSDYASGQVNLSLHLAGLEINRAVTIESQTAWTTPPATLSGSVTWPADSRVSLATGLTVSTGSTLTIGPGTVIRIGSKCNITNNGTILIQGTSGRPVVFLPESAVFPWGGFVMHSPGAKLEATGAIFTGSGAEKCWFDSQFCAKPGAPHSHRGEQALLSCIGTGISVSMIDSAAVFLDGQFGHSVSGGSYNFSFTRFLMQRCTTGGEYTDANFTVNDSAFIECPADTGLFVDGDNDALYLVSGTHRFTNTLFGFCKDDGIDSGASGSGTYRYEDCWFESIYHEANSLSGTGKFVNHHRSVFLNCGQGVEAGYESPQGTMAACLAVGNVVGGRFADNYNWTYNGFLRVTNSILLHNHHDVWGMNWTDWTYRSNQMDVANNYLTTPDPRWPANAVWNPTQNGHLLSSYFNGPANSRVGVGFALWSNGPASQILSNGIPVRLSRFTATAVTVDFEAETSSGIIASGTLEFLPGEMVKRATIPYTSSDLLRIRLLDATNADITDSGELFLHAPSNDTKGPLTLVSKGATWRYLDSGVYPGPGWTTNNSTGLTWKTGKGQLGFGDGDEVTLVASNRQVTTYFTHIFITQDPTIFADLTVSLLRDDGGAVYLNGTEVFRSNLPLGPIDPSTLATNALSQDETSYYYQRTFGSETLLTGTNTVAVEIHQTSATSSDLSFDLELVGNRKPGAVVIGTQRFGRDLILYWDEPGYTLQRASTPNGPWEAVSGVTPCSVPMTGSEAYYRIKRQNP